MKKAVLLVAVFFALCCGGQVRAETDAVTHASHASTPQRLRMKACAAQYHHKNIAKSEYRKFMGECMKEHSKRGMAGPKKENK
jgi:hypothetical protein